MPLSQQRGKLSQGDIASPFLLVCLFISKSPQTYRNVSSKEERMFVLAWQPNAFPSFRAVSHLQGCPYCSVTRGNVQMTTPATSSYQAPLEFGRVWIVVLLCLMCAHVCACTCMSEKCLQRPEEGEDCLIWVSGTELRTPGRSASVPNL